MNLQAGSGHEGEEGRSFLSLTYTFDFFRFRPFPSRRVGGSSVSFRQVVLMIGVLAASFAVAQAPTAPPVPDTDASKVPDPEKIRVSGEAVTKMRTALKDVLGKLEEARSSKDVVKLNCVNEKLTQIKGLLRISEQADVTLQESVAKKETGTAEHEYTKVTIARSKVDQLRAEAEECIGQLAFRTDENLSVEVEVPEYLPSGDPTQMQPAIPVDVRPPPASPTL